MSLGGSKEPLPANVEAGWIPGLGEHRPTPRQLGKALFVHTPDAFDQKGIELPSERNQKPAQGRASKQPEKVIDPPSPKVDETAPVKDDTSEPDAGVQEEAIEAETAVEDHARPIDSQVTIATFMLKGQQLACATTIVEFEGLHVAPVQRIQDIWSFPSQPHLLHARRKGPKKNSVETLKLEKHPDLRPINPVNGWYVFHTPLDAGDRAPRGATTEGEKLPLDAASIVDFRVRF